MHINANKAASFIAVARYEGDVVRTASFAADAPIRDVFNFFWPEEGNRSASVGRFALPFRLEIVPDDQGVPADTRFQRSPFVTT